VQVPDLVDERAGHPADASSLKPAVIPPCVQLIQGTDLGRLRDRQLVGETRERVNLRLPDAVMTRARTSGLTLETRVRVDGDPAQMKVVVYNYASDLVGTASGRVVR
jgi:hypothetical protein